MSKHLRTIIVLSVLVSFILSSIQMPAFAQIDPMPFMPKPGAMVHLSPEYTPAYLKGIVIHPEDPLKFDFIIYKGDKSLTDAQKREEYTKLTKYFLASLAIPDDDQWVNLSPYEKDRIIKDDFGKTEMGRDLLAQDYMLKQITASLIYPEDNLGKQFWQKVYSEAQRQYGTTNIPVNTFNKVWILPDDALIYEKSTANNSGLDKQGTGNIGRPSSPLTAYVLKNHLRVMLEEDYLSLQKHSGITHTVIPASPAESGAKAGIQNTHSIASNIIRPISATSKLSEKSRDSSLASNILRAIILPELQREVNEDKNFAPLRQIYSGMLLATWFKRTLKQSLLGQIYINKAKTKGVDYISTLIPGSSTVIPASPAESGAKAGIQSKDDIEGIYQQYLKAYKKGVFNFIKEDTDKLTNETIPRKYFSGGTADYVMAAKELGYDPAQITHDSAMGSRTEKQDLPKDDVAEVEMNQANAAMTSSIPNGRDSFRFHSFLNVNGYFRNQIVKVTSPGQENVWGIFIEDDFVKKPDGVHRGIALERPDGRREVYTTLDDVNTIVYVFRNYKHALDNGAPSDWKRFTNFDAAMRSEAQKQDEAMNILDSIPQEIRTFKGPVAIVQIAPDVIPVSIRTLIGRMFIERNRWENALVLATFNGRLLFINKDTKNVDDVIEQYREADISKAGFLAFPRQPREGQADYLERLQYESEYNDHMIFRKTRVPIIVLGAIDGKMKFFYKGQELDAAMRGENKAMAKMVEFTYAIEPLDSLQKIALRAGFPTVDAFVAVNRQFSIYNSLPEIGTIIRIKTNALRFIYVVQPNDTMFSVVMNLGVIHQDRLAILNGFSTVYRDLKPGERLQIDRSEQIPEDLRQRLANIPQTLKGLSGNLGIKLYSDVANILREGILGLRPEYEVESFLESRGYNAEEITRTIELKRKKLGLEAGEQQQGSPSEQGRTRSESIADSYFVLGLKPGANKGEIRAAWAKLVREIGIVDQITDPVKKRESEERLKDINRSYNVLKNSAMIAANRDHAASAKPGGIDLNSANLNLHIKRDGNGAPLPLSQQDLAQLSNIQGLDPVILSIKPASQTALFSQLAAQP